MPKISLLKVKTIEYGSDDDLRKLIRYLKRILDSKIENLDDPSADAAINAIAFNMVRLMREREKYKKEPPSFVVFDGGKKD